MCFRFQRFIKDPLSLYIYIYIYIYYIYKHVQSYLPSKEDAELYDLVKIFQPILV